MHLSDGVMPVLFWVSGWGLAAFGVWRSVRALDSVADPAEVVPRAAVLTGLFFLVSLPHFPVPPTSFSLLLTGLMGVMLGWLALPAIMTGLFLQAAMFGHGGLLAIGANTVMLGFPAVMAGKVFHVVRDSMTVDRRDAVAGFIAGVSAPMGSALLQLLFLGAVLPLAGVSRELVGSVWWLPLAYLPVSALEGAITAALVVSVLRVSPGLVPGLSDEADAAGKPGRSGAVSGRS